MQRNSEARKAIDKRTPRRIVTDGGHPTAAVSPSPERYDPPALGSTIDRALGKLDTASAFLTAASAFEDTRAILDMVMVAIEATREALQYLVSGREVHG
jgi:hypothetical protein